MAYNERGEEVLDDTPIEVPLKFKRPPSIQEMIQLYVRSELQVRGLMAPDATSEEDFDVGDDAADDILTPYELHALAADMEAGLDKMRKKGDNKGTVNNDRDKGDNRESESRRKDGGVDGSADGRGKGRVGDAVSESDAGSGKGGSDGVGGGSVQKGRVGGKAVD